MVDKQDPKPAKIDNWGRIAADHMPLVKECCTLDMDGATKIQCPMGKSRDNKEPVDPEKLGVFSPLICGGKLFLIITTYDSHYSSCILRELKPFKHVSNVSDLSFDFDKLVFEYASFAGNSVLCLMDNQRRWYFADIIVNMPGYRCSLIISEPKPDIGLPIFGGDKLIVMGETSVLQYEVEKTGPPASSLWTALKNMIFHNDPQPPVLKYGPFKLRDLDEDRDTEERFVSIKSFQPNGDVLFFSPPEEEGGKHSCAFLRPICYITGKSLDPETYFYHAGRCNHEPPAL